MNLRRIEDVFSASKTKVMMRALQDDGKMKPCNILLFERSEFYLKEGKDIVHPFYLVQETSRNFNKNWDWYKQASRIHAMIDKDCTTVPNVGDTLLDWYKNEIIYFDGQTDLYKPVNKTIPVHINQSTKKRLLEKEDEYLRKNKLSKVDKIVTIGHIDDTPVKTIPKRVQPIDWLRKVKVSFNEMDEKKMKKTSLSNIFRVTIDKDIEPIYTDRHKDWIKQGIDLLGLFRTTLTTVSRIDDFRRKFLMSYWGNIEKTCCLCNKPFNRMHLFSKCSVVKIWEDEVYIKRKDKVDIARVRIESMFNHKLSTHTLSWIYNWCIWKNYWEVKFQKFEKSEELENQINNFRELIKFNEYLHFMYSNATVKGEKIEKVANQTQLFSFFRFEKGYIEEIRREVKREKAKKKSCFFSIKKRKKGKFKK